MRDPYEVLGAPHSATAEEIKRRFRALAKQWHPDRHNGSKEAEEKFKEILSAYRAISNPEEARTSGAWTPPRDWCKPQGLSFMDIIKTVVDIFGAAAAMQMASVKEEGQSDLISELFASVRARRTRPKDLFEEILG